jgi:membrane-associated phospholipid phosphatase
MRTLRRNALLVSFITARSLAAQRAPAPAPNLADTVTSADSGTKAPRRSRVSVHAIGLNRRVATGFVIASIALMPLDRGAEAWLQSPNLQTSPTAKAAAATFNWIGGAGVLAGGVAALAIGRLTGSDRVSEIGLRTTEAIVAGGIVVGAMKGVMGRQRPFLEKNDPGDFFIGRGFANGGLTSFPSGHTAAAFSAATVLSLESRRLWPRMANVITPALYAGAAAVGFARMYDSKHWASDVALGATIGTLSGIQVMRYNDARPHNAIARWLAHTSLAPAGERSIGIGLSFNLR